MSELWICREQTAKKPFRLKTAGVDIWTIEELCFYLYQNAEHPDEDVMDEALIVWIGEELGLRELALTLRREQRKGRDELWCVWFLLKEGGMYADEELTEIRSACLALENKDEFERRKLKADRLLQNKKYVRSIQEYHRLIEMGEGGSSSELEGDIWHNLGVAHAGLFLFPEAAECFLKAYKKNMRRESLQAYEDALELAEAAEQEAETALPAAMTADAEDLKDTDWKECLRELKEAYRKNVM